MDSQDIKPELPEQVNSAFDTFKDSIEELFASCESEYSEHTKKRDIPDIAPSFIKRVNALYKHYKRFMEVLNTSRLSAEKICILTREAQRSISELLPEAFKRVRNKYYAYMSDQFEAHYIKNIHDHETESFVTLFHEQIIRSWDAKSIEALEDELQIILDAHLPNLITVFNLTDEEIIQAFNEEWNASQQQLQSGDSVFSRVQSERWSTFIRAVHISPHQAGEMNLNQEHFNQVCQQLNTVGLRFNWTKVVKKRIIKSARILDDNLSNDDWAVSVLPLYLKWAHVSFLPWISYIVPKDKTDRDANWCNFLREKVKLEHIIYEAFYYTRIPHIFDIIVDYPDSRQTIADLHVAITRRGLVEEFKQELIQQLRARLLHQGASAMDILLQYIVCIECLKIIDPSCEILAPVIDLIKRYMNSRRSDTVQGVVDMIREINDEDEEELVKFPKDMDDVHVFSEAELKEDQHIKTIDDLPEGKLAKLAKLQKKTKDPVAMLISVCGSLNAFINGYCDRFGEALLLCTNYSTEAEERRLEYLKRNFPPDAFHRCDIMLRDMSNSRRIDRMIHEHSQVDPTLHTIMMSGKYWRGDDEDNDFDSDTTDEDEDEETVCRAVERYLRGDTSIYRQEYEKVQASRRLSYSPLKGSVSLTLEFETREPLSLTVATGQALVIQLFHSKDQHYTMEQVKQETGLSMDKVAACLTYWLEKNILQLSASGHFSLVME